MKVSRAEALRQVKYGPDDEREEKSIPLSWLQGRSLSGATPDIRASIERALDKAERAALKQTLKNHRITR